MLLTITLALGIFASLVMGSTQPEKEEKEAGFQVCVFLLNTAFVGGICLCLSYKYLWVVELISPLLQLATTAYLVILTTTTTSLFGEFTIPKRDDQWSMLWVSYAMGAFFLTTSWLKQAIFRIVIFVVTWHYLFVRHT